MAVPLTQYLDPARGQYVGIDPASPGIQWCTENIGSVYPNFRFMPALMRQVDWVLVPSVWWENSPVIIQEAFFHGRPVICSGVGGMAEKVRDGVDGLHFLGGSPEDLSDRLCEALEDRDLWDTLRKGIPQPQDYVSCAQEHLSIYRAVRSSRTTPTAALPHNLKQSA